MSELQQSQSYWIGRLQEADYWIEMYSKFRTARAKAALTKLKKSRAEALEMIAKLARS